MLSIERNHSACHVNSTKEIASCLVIARHDGAVLFNAGKEVFNQVASLVQVLVIAALLFTRAARWNHNGLAAVVRRWQVYSPHELT